MYRIKTLNKISPAGLRRALDAFWAGGAQNA